MATPTTTSSIASQCVFSFLQRRNGVGAKPVCRKQFTVRALPLLGRKSFYGDGKKGCDYD